MEEKEKNKVEKRNGLGTLGRLLRYMALDRTKFVLVIIFTILSSAASVLGIAALEPIINDYLVPYIGQKNPEMSGLFRMLVLISIMYAVGALSTYLQRRIIIEISNKTLFTLREDLMNKMLDLPIKYFDDRTHGEIMSRFTNDVEAIRIAAQQSFTELLGAVLVLVGIFIAMFFLNIILAIFAIFMLAIMLFIVRKMGNISGSHFREQQIIIGSANGYLEELIEGQKVVKVFNHEKQVNKEFNEITKELEKVGVVANTFANYIMPITMNISYFHYILTAVIGSYLALKGMITLGVLLPFMQFSRMMANPITQVSQQFNSILMALAGAERVFSVIDAEPEIDEGTATLVNVKYNSKNDIEEVENRTGLYAWKYLDGYDQTKYRVIKGDIVFQDVTFSYDGKNKILKNINIHAMPGKKIALVGSTGAGKTTITNLLNRFYEIEDGDIIYDGINIKNIKKSHLRRSLSLVLQDTNLFTESIKENIRYGRLDAAEEEIFLAAKLANAHEFIMEQPDGYNTILTDSGASLSQGQRQLLSIARASVADPVTLILDEATSSIDTRTERLIEKGMDKLMEGRTVFIIAHRLSTIRNSDMILVMEQGEIVEQGEHDILIEKKGRYYQLHTGMFELS